MRTLTLSFSAISPRAAPVPRLIAVSRASGHVVSCARARARNFVASRTISIFSVTLWGVIVCVRIHAVIKNVTSLRHDTWRAGRTMDPSFDAAKITSNLLCASRLCVSDAAEEAASAQMPRHRGRAIDRPTCRRDAARMFARANLLIATTTTPSAATCSSRCSSARGSTGGFPESFRGQRHRRCRRARRAFSSASVFARAGWILLFRTAGAARQQK